MVITHTVKAGAWFGSYLTSKNDYCLVGCTVVPGFEYNEFEILYDKKVDGFDIPQDLHFMI